MAEQSAHLVDRVLPEGVRYRQYVLTFPRELALRLAFDADLATAVIQVFMRVLFEWLRERAPQKKETRVHAAAVVFVHRFADAATTYYHLHALVPDAVFREHLHASHVDTEPMPPPTDAAVAELVRRIERRILGLLRRRGLLGTDPDATDTTADDSEPNEALDEARLLTACAQAPPERKIHIAGGGPQRRPKVSRTAKKRPALCAESGGFEIHTGVSTKADDRGALERLCRYLSRPPLAQDRIHLLPDGRVAFDLKRLWKGSIRQLVFSPLAFVARLAALVPLPGRHMVRFFGVLAPGSSLRRHVVPDPPDDPDRPTAPKRPKRMKWAELLKRIWRIDITNCPRPGCSGRLRPIAFIRDPDVIETILAAIALSTQPELPSRGPPPPVAR